MAVDTRRATKAPANVLSEYVEEADRAERRRRGQIRCRSRLDVRDAGYLLARSIFPL
jgi:hypothetical protein